MRGNVLVTKNLLDKRAGQVRRPTCRLSSSGRRRTRLPDRESDGYARCSLILNLLQKRLEQDFAVARAVGLRQLRPAARSWLCSGGCRVIGSRPDSSRHGLLG